MVVQSRALKFLFIAVLVLAAGLLGWKFLKPKQEKPQYLTATVARGDIEDSVLATGVLQAQQLVSVGSQVSGQVKKMYVQLGDQVKKGQPIAQIDSVRQQNDLSNQKAAINNLQAQKAIRQATLKEAELTFKRQRDMLAQDATSRAEFESAQAALETARANIKAIDAQIEQTQLAVSTAQENLGYTQITAPIDGTVVAIVTEQGQTVNANQTAPTIVRLAKLDTMTIKAQISEADVMRIHPGQTVYFTTLGEPDKKIYATLRSIEPAPDSIISENNNSSANSNNAVYYNALFDVPNPDGRLRINMTAQVYIVLREANNVLTIPAAALQNSGKKGRRNKEQNTASQPASQTTRQTAHAASTGETNRQPRADGKAGKPATVRVLDSNGNAVERKIRVGLNNRIDVEVLSGLKEGEEVVIADSSDSSNDKAKRSNSGRSPMRF